jgi:hypothetical protein
LVTVNTRPVQTAAGAWSRPRPGGAGEAAVDVDAVWVVFR